MTLHAVDGTYELYRAQYSKRPRRTARVGGREIDVTGVVGLLASLVALLGDEDEAVTHVAYAFDRPIRSFRNDLFAGYKDDSGVPTEIADQMELAEEAVAALGVRALRMIEHEADDALATLARDFADHGVRVLSPDKDLAQCLDGARVVTVDRSRRRVVTARAFEEARGFAPGLVPDFLALVGDPQDGIPGIPGFGERTTAALLAAFGPLERIPDDARAWPTAIRGRERLAPVLAARREDAALYKRLATLVSTVPLGVTLGDLEAPRAVSPAFEALAARLGAAELVDRARAAIVARLARS